MLALVMLLAACSGTSTPAASSSEALSTEASKTEASSTEASPTDASAAESASSVASSEASVASAEPTATRVEITDAHGTVSVPVNPKSVVSLDNRTFETLSDWGIQLAAVPKGVMPKDISYVQDEAVQDIGNHREPNLEIIAAANPDLVIVGQRFASFYDDIKKLVPNAAVIDLNIDVSETSQTPGKNLVEGLKNSTTTLGKIFSKEKEAEALNASFDKAIEDVRSNYPTEQTVMSVVVSGGKIGFSAPLTGRVWGPMYEVFGWKSALEVGKASSDHQGDDISVEAIAKSNPDWIMVLDRDAATASADGAVPAKDVISGSEALQNTTAVQKGHVLYAPNDTYTNESIQTYLELFQSIADAFRASK